MADEPKTKAELNPHAWVTPGKFLEFMKARNVSMVCERCGNPNAWWIDTGSEGGYVPRIASMPQRPDGKAATGDTYQMPVIRVTCLNCGNIRLHALQALDIWKQLGKAAVTLKPEGGEK